MPVSNKISILLLLEARSDMILEALNLSRLWIKYTEKSQLSTSQAV